MCSLMPTVVMSSVVMTRASPGSPCRPSMHGINGLTCTLDTGAAAGGGYQQQAVAAKQPPLQPTQKLPFLPSRAASQSGRAYAKTASPSVRGSDATHCPAAAQPGPVHPPQADPAAHMKWSLPSTGNSAHSKLCQPSHCAAHFWIVLRSLGKSVRVVEGRQCKDRLAHHQVFDATVDNDACLSISHMHLLCAASCQQHYI